MVLLSLWLIAAALVEVRTSADGQAGNEEMVQIDLPIKRHREYELVTPVSTNFEGHYLSHILSANHKKRSTRDVSSNSEQLFFNITAFGRDFHLRLKPNTQLVAPGAVVEWQETSLVPGNITDPVNAHQPGVASERIWKTEPLQTNCAYVGDIMDIPGTSVAISNCDGLVRLIPSCVYMFAGIWEYSMVQHDLGGRGGKEASLLCFKRRKKH
uniref:ADAM metallopeptidase with thrombospondin type 1 motif 3 n=1 Tax=Equus caballus TaxID=9796 RepID=F7A3A4_HORSE